MSITGAVAELNTEIERLTEEITRITAIRDSLLKEAPQASTSRAASAAAKKTATKKKPAKKSRSVATTAPAKSAPAKKRTMSPEAKKRIGDANRKRWAAVRKAKAAAAKQTSN